MVRTAEVSSRWYPQTLSKRILNIARMREHYVHQGRWIPDLRENAHLADAIFFSTRPIQPLKAGSRLYNHSELDHEELFRL